MSLRSGITDAHLDAAGVRAVSAVEAEKLCGLKRSGLWIPYRDLDGNPVRDGDRDYGRLRLDEPIGDMKYYQRKGSAVHAFFPPRFAEHLTGGDLAMIEGEFKAMSLDESGVQAIGVSGFYGFGAKSGQKDEERWQLLPEIADAISWGRPSRVLFVGDSDTFANHHFPRAVAVLAPLIRPLPLLLPRLAPGNAKGIDDLKEALAADGKDFAAEWSALVADAYEHAGGGWELLAVDLLEIGLKHFKALRGAEREKAERHMVELAGFLNPINQGRAAKAIATATRATAGDVKKQIKEATEKAEETEKPQGSALEFEEVEPADDPVPGEELLDQLQATFERFVFLPPHAAVACSLWVAHTYFFQLFDFSAVLSLTSPEKRCGKSTLLELLRLLVSRPLFAASISAPALYRVVESHRPTLLIDEADSVGEEAAEAQRNVVNSGYHKSGCVIRCVGDDFEPRSFSTFCPKALAAIGELAGTIADRAIPVRLDRKPVAVQLERLRDFDSLPIRRALVRWAKDQWEQAPEDEPEPVHSLNDRASDIWQPLRTIAAAAGPRWLKLATEAAVALSGEEAASAGLGEMLLADIRAVFGEQRTDKLSSEDLCRHLADLDGRPWSEFGKQQKPITKAKLARLLKRFGVQPRKVRIPGQDQTVQGYSADLFEAAFAQYLPPSPLSNRNTGTKPVNIDDSALFNPEQPADMFHFENSVSPNKDGGCSGVPLSTGGDSGKNASNDAPRSNRRRRRGPVTPEKILSSKGPPS